MRLFGNTSYSFHKTKNSFLLINLLFTGVPYDASDKQITVSYNKLSFKYDPERNPDDEFAAKAYEKINEAYLTLNNVDTKKIYDNTLQINQPINNDNENSLNSNYSHPTSTTNSFGKVFDSMISHFSSNNKIFSSQDIIDTSLLLIKQGNLNNHLGPPLDTRLIDLSFGWSNNIKVDKQIASYYRITLDSNHINNGFFITLNSNNKGKFKLLIFNNKNDILFNEDCHNSNNKSYRNYSNPNSIYNNSKSNETEITLFFTNFNTYDFNSTSNSTSTSTRNQRPVDHPLLLTKLNNFRQTNQKIEAGQYLLVIHGDNLIGKTNVNVLISLANNSQNTSITNNKENMSEEIIEMIESDNLLLETKNNIEKLTQDYMKVSEFTLYFHSRLFHFNCLLG